MKDTGDRRRKLKVRVKRGDIKTPRVHYLYSVRARRKSSLGFRLLGDGVHALNLSAYVINNKDNKE